MMKIILKLTPLLLMLLISCPNGGSVEMENGSKTKMYLHISHTRTSSNSSMDSVVELIDYSKFDMLWLGGDLAPFTSKDNGTMTKIDSVFDVGNEKTLWALGNHDYTDLNRVEEFTKRPPYHSLNQNGITLVVLDTQDSLSNITGNQKDLLFEVLDTIQESTHLVLLSHKLVWMYENAELEPQISSISNGGFGSCFHCINPNNFNSEIYPRLVEVKRNGIQVVCVGGDIGFKTKEFEYTTSDGINFLASGISSGENDNKALLFHHDVINGQLTWEYKLIEELLVE